MKLVLEGVVSKYDEWTHYPTGEQHASMDVALLNGRYVLTVPWKPPSPWGKAVKVTVEIADEGGQG
jgi:hypothetical protein